VGRLGSSVLVFGFQLDSLVYAYIYIYAYIHIYMYILDFSFKVQSR
jgi:hypothetical protein